MANDSDFDFVMPHPRRSIRPLGVANSNSTYDRSAGYYGALNKSPQSSRKSLFDSGKENDEEFYNRDGEKKIKPRRSMLGLRSKMGLNTYASDDNTYTISKPLYSSSPVAPESSTTESWENENKQEPKLYKTASTPTIVVHPFDSSDADTSSFFTKGHSDSCWSVFKSKTTKPLSRTSVAANTVPKFHSSEDNLAGRNSNWSDNKSSNHRQSVTAEQKQSLEWLSAKFQEEMRSVGTSKGKDYDKNVDNDLDTKSSYRSENRPGSKDETEHDVPFGRMTRAQAKKEREKCTDSLMEQVNRALGTGSHSYNNNSSNHNSYDPRSSTSDIENTRESSVDSFLINEATVTLVVNSNNHEVAKQRSLHDSSVSSKSSESAEEVDSDEYLSVDEDVERSQDLTNVFNLLSELKSEKELLDTAYNKFLERKEVYDKKWDNLMDSVHKIKLDSKKPQKHGSERSASKLNSNKNFSSLKANFQCLKTPVRSIKKNNRLRKSVCYTPNSLSVRVGDQINDIFGDL